MINALFEQKKEQQPFVEELKRLSKKFKCLKKLEMKILVEFCQYDFKVAENILTVISELKKPDLIIKELIDRPEKSDQIIQKYLEIYRKSYGQKEQEIIEQKVIHSKQETVQSQLAFFENLPKDTILEIALYLNPIEMSAFLNLSKQFKGIYQSSKVVLQNYFKKICRTLFINEQPVLPTPCRFEKLKQYIITHPLEFSPNTRSYVLNNLRAFVWQRSPEMYKVNREYFVKFGGFQKIYQNAPRVHFNGYYILREKYTKRGEQTLEMSGVPYHVVHYYRYIRFFPDGSVLYQISNKKMKDDKITETLSIKNLINENSDVLAGQFMQFKNQLFVKIFRLNSVFFYEFQINGIFKGLTVKKFDLELMDSSFITQQLYRPKEFCEAKVFQYKPQSDLALQNPLNIQSCSL